VVGTTLAWWQGFSPLVAVLALIPPACCKFLSNLANDYGDAVKGSDRTVSGRCAGCKRGDYPEQMKRALIITIVLICISGLAAAAGSLANPGDFIGFLVLGALSIIAAITYTVGTRPYGYIGLGDISVLISSAG
jgi:1,4-dihydroxy-2-naphthoate octaprenyltransferase